MRAGTDNQFHGRPSTRRPGGDRLVMQVCIADGTISPLYRLSIERARAYARRVGAAYRLITGGHDVLYADPPHIILQKYLDKDIPLLFSAERLFTHHYTSHRDHFDREAPGSVYRYPNSGGLIGRAGAIAEMLDALREVDRNVPQSHEHVLESLHERLVVPTEKREWCRPVARYLAD